MQNEQWIDIPGQEGKYKISSFGRVKSLPRSRYRCKERLLKLSLDSDGYLQFSIPTENRKSISKKVHRIMALVFIPNPENKPQVNHKDGCRTNNMLSNLEWATAAENVQHGFDKNGRKIENLTTRKAVNQLSINGQPIKEWASVLQVSKELGFDRSTIMKAIRKNRPYYGFYWQLAINKSA